MWEHSGSMGISLLCAGVLAVFFVGAAIFATWGEQDPPPEGRRYPWVRLDEVLAAIRDPGWSWTRNNRCKYISVRMDTRTRTNLCVIYDRRGEPITLEELKHQEGRGR